MSVNYDIYSLATGITAYTVAAPDSNTRPIVAPGYGLRFSSGSGPTPPPTPSPFGAIGRFDVWRGQFDGEQAFMGDGTNLADPDPGVVRGLKVYQGGAAIVGGLKVDKANGIFYAYNVPTDGVTDGYAAIMASVALAQALGRAVLELPPGVIAMSQGITVNGPSSWLPSTNITLTIRGSGQRTTVLLATASMTSLYHKDGLYNEGGGLENITLDGANQVTYPFWFEQGNHYRFANITVKNAAAGGIGFRVGTDTTTIGESVFRNIEVIGLDSGAYSNPALMPAYGMKVSASDSHFSDIIVSNAATSCVTETTYSGGNRWSRVHTYGFREPNLIQWVPQYGIQAGGTASKWEGLQGDGATVAAIDVLAYDVGISNAHIGFPLDQITSAFTTGTFATTVQAASGATTLTSFTNFGMAVGQYLIYPGVQAGTTVTAINTSTHVITLSLPTTAIIPANASIAVGATAQAAAAVGVRLSTGSGSCVVTGVTFTQVTPANAITLNGTAGSNIVVNNPGASYGAGALVFDSLVSSNGYIPVSTPNGVAGALYAPAGAVNFLSMNASSTGSQLILAANPGVGGDTNIDVRISPYGTGTVRMTKVTVDGVATVGGISSSGDITTSGVVSTTRIVTGNVLIGVQTSAGYAAYFFAAANSVDCLTFNASAAGNSDVQITISGSSTNKNIALTPIGTGYVKVTSDLVVLGKVILGAASGPIIRQASGVPSDTQPKGSINIRTDGGVGTTLYVANGSAGGWNAIAGV